MTHPDCATTPQSAFRKRLLPALLCLAACGGEEPGEAPRPGAESSPEPQGVFGVAPSAVAGAPAVVELHPGGAPPALPTRPNPRMDQLGLAFTPGTLLVRVGETVQFTNSETVAHNIHIAFSDNDSTILDYDTDPAGAVDHVFDLEGGYEVTCELHPGMRAFIYATSAPYAGFAQNNGAFRITDVPPGRYTLSFWSVDPMRRSDRPLEVTGGSTEVVP